MARLIEIQDPSRCPSPLVVTVGDVLLVRATGGRVGAPGGAVELLGPFLPAVLGDNGEVLSPMGTPGTVLVLARAAGRAVITVMAGDPFQPPQTSELSISVEA